MLAQTTRHWRFPAVSWILLFAFLGVCASQTVQLFDQYAVKSIDNPKISGNKIFFLADTNKYGRELWVADLPLGSSQARLVKDIFPGTQGSVCHSCSIAIYPTSTGIVYFTANSGNGTRLMKSDGTAAGTVEVASVGFPTGSDDLISFVEVDGWVYILVRSEALGFPNRKNVVFVSPADGSSLSQYVLTETDTNFYGAAISNVGNVAILFRNIPGTQGACTLAFDRIVPPASAGAPPTLEPLLRTSSRVCSTPRLSLCAGKLFQQAARDLPMVFTDGTALGSDVANTTTSFTPHIPSQCNILPNGLVVFKAELSQNVGTEIYTASPSVPNSATLLVDLEPSTFVSSSCEGFTTVENRVYFGCSLRNGTAGLFSTDGVSVQQHHSINFVYSGFEFGRLGSSLLYRGMSAGTPVYSFNTTNQQVQLFGDSDDRCGGPNRLFSFLPHANTLYFSGWEASVGPSFVGLNSGSLQRALASPFLALGGTTGQYSAGLVEAMTPALVSGSTLVFNGADISAARSLRFAQFSTSTGAIIQRGDTLKTSNLCDGYDEIMDVKKLGNKIVAILYPALNQSTLEVWIGDISDSPTPISNWRRISNFPVDTSLHGEIHLSENFAWFLIQDSNQNVIRYFRINSSYALEEVGPATLRSQESTEALGTLAGDKFLVVNCFQSNNTCRVVTFSAAGSRTLGAADIFYPTDNQKRFQFKGRIFFIASSASNPSDYQVFGTDGTTAGTFPLRITPNDTTAEIEDFAVVPAWDRIAISGYPGPQGSSLIYLSDGSRNLAPLITPDIGSRVSQVTNLMSFGKTGDKLCFLAISSSSGGSQRLHCVNRTGSVTFLGQYASNPFAESFTALHGTDYLSVLLQESGTYNQIYVTDGTAARTVQIAPRTSISTSASLISVPNPDSISFVILDTAGSAFISGFCFSNSDCPRSVSSCNRTCDTTTNTCISGISCGNGETCDVNAGVCLPPPVQPPLSPAPTLAPGISSSPTSTSTPIVSQSPNRSPAASVAGPKATSSATRLISSTMLIVSLLILFVF